MLDHEDLKWIAGTSTELNSILQQIARYADLARRHKGEHHYIDLLIQRVELASKTAQALFDRVTSTILAKTTAKTAAPTAPSQATFIVVPPPVVHAFPARAARAKLPIPNNEKPKLATEKNLRRSQAGRAYEPWSARASIPPEITVKNPKGNREYLLFIEDETQVATLAAEMLADEGHKGIVAKDGFEALEIYREIGKRSGWGAPDAFQPARDGDARGGEAPTSSPKVRVVLGA